jgi:energy-coupling factor transporter ATP-binding protein EcfA2
MAGLVPHILGGQASGTLEVANHDWLRQPEQQQDRQVGMIFDYAGQLTQLKVFDEVMVPLRHCGMAEPEAATQARQLLDSVGLEHEALAGRRVWELSEGQQQRLAIAAMLAIDPQVLIFDDAMSMLDSQGQAEMRSILHRLAGEKTLVVVEQDAELMQSMDRLLVLVGGKLVAQGTPDEILCQHELLERAQLEPPLPQRLAHTLGLPAALYSPKELAQALSAVARNPAPLPPPTDQLGAVLVHLDGVTYCYPDGAQALTDVHLQVHAGEVHAVTGSSGAGKTTLAKHIAGLVKPTAGMAWVCGADTRQRRVAELAVTVGTVLQNPDEQISEGTVRDEIRFPLKQRQYERNSWWSKRQRYDEDYIAERQWQACELVGIAPDLLDCDPILLPRGQRKLVTMAAALMMDPQVLILDEPTLSLGAAACQHLRQMLTRLRDLGKAVLLADNKVDFVAEVADTVTVLEQGRVVLQGPVRTVFAEANWAQLTALALAPPRVAQLAQRLGVTALTYDELIAQLRRKT